MVQGTITEKTLSIPLAGSVLEIFPNWQCLLYSKDFKGDLLFWLDMAPLVALYFPWPNVFKVFKRAYGMDLLHSRSRKAALIMLLFFWPSWISVVQMQKKEIPGFTLGLSCQHVSTELYPQRKPLTRPQSGGRCLNHSNISSAPASSDCLNV